MSFEQNTSGFPELRGYRRTQTWVIGGAMLLLCLATLMPLIGFARNYQFLGSFFYWRQDLLLSFLFLLIPALPLGKHEVSDTPRWMAFLVKPAGLFTVAAGLIALCWLGRHFVYLDYNLSRDEQMADFDAYILAHGKLFWPLPKFWQIHAPALNQLFMLPIGDHEAWVSAYLPVNAALRAVTGFVVPASLTSPLLVAIGAVSLWRIAGRLWPDSPSARAVALILYTGSSQVLVTGMTDYAMNGHLAMNLVWLDLFLLNKRWSHLGALIVGFLATGLHQPLFHPLFALWFVVLLCVQRRWRTFAFYAAGYLLIVAFWFSWLRWISSHGVGYVAPLDAGTPNYIARFVREVRPLSMEAIWLTAMNLLRFITWQHLLLLPLMAVGIRVSWKQNPLARAIAISFMLPIVAMMVLLPYQGHGWGYRYLHGVIGNACLLACYGWVALESRGLLPRRMLAWTTATTFLLVLPIRGAMVHQMVASFAGVSRTIAASPARFAIVDDQAAPFGLDIVVNRPDLSNQPIQLIASGLHPSEMAEICARGSIAFVEAPVLKPIAEYFGAPLQLVSSHVLSLEQAAKDNHCSFVYAPKISE